MVSKRVVSSAGAPGHVVSTGGLAGGREGKGDPVAYSGGARHVRASSSTSSIGGGGSDSEDLVRMATSRSIAGRVSPPATSTAVMIDMAESPSGRGRDGGAGLGRGGGGAAGGLPGSPKSKDGGGVCPRVENRTVIKFCWWLVTLTIVAFIPLGVVELVRHRSEVPVVGWFVGGIFVALAVPLTVWEVSMHLDNYNRPALQRPVIRILLMVPIYAINAWLAMRYKALAFYLDTLRECYEAFVIHSFMAYLASYLEGEAGASLEVIVRDRPPLRHAWPLSRVMEPWTCADGALVRRCRQGVTTYIIWRPLCSAIAVVLEARGEFEEGSLALDRGYIYTTSIVWLSQMWALYCLVVFYRVFREDLAPMNPVGKFIIVKSVVFFTFWQRLGIEFLLKRTGLADEWISSWNMEYTADEFVNGFQNFLLCIEMFVAAVAHTYTFSYRDYLAPGARSPAFFRSLIQMFDVSDLQDDVLDQLRAQYQEIVPFRRKRGKTTVSLDLDEDDDDDDFTLPAVVKTAKPATPR